MPHKNHTTIAREGRPTCNNSEPMLWNPSQSASQCSRIQHTKVPNTLRTPQIRTLLERLFARSTQDDETPCWQRPGLSWETATAQERADASESVYMPISPQAGDLLYILVRAKRPNTVIEFGTSYGISTIYLAAAVADNGTGEVVTTELSATKVLAASANLEEARLADRVTILLGDARTTLSDIPGPIDFVLLDGWKELCLPVLQSLEPRLATGALAVADDINLPSLGGYLGYVATLPMGMSRLHFLSKTAWK